MQRDFERDDPRRRYGMRDDPRQRFGNEEDWGEFGRPPRPTPSGQHDDRSYERRGYEPEMGEPGQRVEGRADRGRRPDDPYAEHSEGYGNAPSGGMPGERFGREGGAGRGEAEGRGGQQRFGSGDDWRGGSSGGGRQQPGTWPGARAEQFGGSYGREPRRQGGFRAGSGDDAFSASPSSRFASAYDQGDVGSWYGGDTGMGDSGGSHDRHPYGGGGQSRGGGRYSGRGPRGYRRSDERIYEDVCETLTDHGGIDASMMEVEVRDGTVILRGMVDSGSVRRMTEEVVEDIPGVTDVQNELRVNRRTGYDTDAPGARWQTGGESGMRSQSQSSGPFGHGSGMGSTGTASQGTAMGGMSGQGASMAGQGAGTVGQSMSGGGREQTTPAYGTGVAETSGVSDRAGYGQPGTGAGAGASRHGNPWQVHESMEVVGSDGERIGSVKDVRGTDFLVDRTMGEDVYVPFVGVQTVDGHRVMLRCRASEVDRQGWPNPSGTAASQTIPSGGGASPVLEERRS